MADYTDTKEGIGSVVNDGVIDADWNDLECLITPEKLREIHLWGIPLVSNIKDPITKKPQVMNDPLLKKIIIEAAALAEAESKIRIFPKAIEEKHAFDRVAYDNFGYFQLRQLPVASLESITVVPSNEEPIFQLPLEWVDVGYLHLGQVNLIPLTIALRSGTMVPLVSSAGGATLLSIFGNRAWIPSFWKFNYTIGFPNGKISKVVNQYIGTIAAMEVLSLLATTYARTNSTSLGIDGLSQSMSTPGSEIFKARLEDLAAKRQWLVGRLQAQYGVNIIVDNV